MVRLRSCPYGAPGVKQLLDDLIERRETHAGFVSECVQQESERPLKRLGREAGSDLNSHNACNRGAQ